MDMKKLLNIVSENKTNEECGMPMSQIPQEPYTPPMTMSVNMNANGADQIKDLLQLLSKQAEEPMPTMIIPPAVPSPAPTGDNPMKQIAGLLDEPKDKPFSNSPAEKIADIDSVTKDAGGGMNGPKNPKDLRVKDPRGFPEEEFANEPDEKYSDHKLMTKDLSGGINREKQMFKAAQRGDNAMSVESIRAQLDRRYREIKEGNV